MEQSANGPAVATKHAGSVLDQAVASIPGIAALVVAFRLPEDIRVIAETSLLLVVTSTLAWLRLRRHSIVRADARHIGWLLSAATVGAIVCFIGFGLSFTAIVAPYAFGGGTGRIFTPSHYTSGKWQHPYIDCRLTPDADCQDGVQRQADSADEISTFLNANGPAALRINRDAPWYIWGVAIIALDCITAAALVIVFGLIRIRRLAPGRLFGDT